MYFCDIENFAYGEINERSFSNPTPGLDWLNYIESVKFVWAVYMI